MPGLRPTPSVDASPFRASSPPVAAIRSALEPFLVGTEAVREGGAATLIVALSGGLDSVVLLHVLRFALGAELRGIGPRATDVRLVAAHFDHGMRPGSSRDAVWVRGICRAWDVELDLRRAAEGPTSEDEARTTRYRFLEDVARAHERPIVLTAHHADDQAETVLFRALRGTGIEGLAGIPRVRPLRASRPTISGSEVPGGDSTPTGGGFDPSATLVRPLLDVWREDLEGYATRQGLRWRDDPTNDHLGYARNVLRHEIIPLAEEKVAAGARRALVRLAAIARDEDAAWTSAMPLIVEAIDAASCGHEASCDRTALLDLGPELSARVVRHLVASVGHAIDADATRRAVDFVRDSQSGRRIELGGGVELALEGDRVVVVR